MPGHTYLPCNNTIFPQFGGTGNTGLCSNHCVLSDLNIVGNLNKVIQFYTVPDDGGITRQRCTINHGIGANTNIIFNNYVSHLRDGFITSILLWCKAKTITANNSACVYYAMASDFCSRVYFYIGM